MHLLTLTAPCCRPDGQTLPPGTYIVEDTQVPELMAVADRETAMLEHFDWHHAEHAALTPTLPDDGRSWLLVHPGGFGDLMLLGPSIRALKRRFPSAKVYVACRERSRCVFGGLAYPDGFEDYPLPIEAYQRHGHVRFLENVNEVGEEARTLHAVETKARRIGINLEGDVTVEYKVEEGEAQWAHGTYTRVAKPAACSHDGPFAPRLGVQLAASAANRTYDHDLLFHVLGDLFKRGYEILLFGTPGSTEALEIPKHLQERVRNLAKERLTFRQSAAVLSTCDVALTPDSSLMHVAGALGLPCVALFGPIHWRQRTSFYPSVRAIQGHADCAPCWYHERHGLHWPKGKPCEKEGRCVAINAIQPDGVVLKVEKALRQSLSTA